MTRWPKIPRTPTTPLVREDEDVREEQPVIWRIHRTRGEHVLGWNVFRTFGPLSSGRYDPHPLPRGDYPGCGVTYAATELRTALAEAFQANRRVNRHEGAPYATSWSPTRPLRLLDLTGDWALRNKAAHSLAFAPRPACRAWSRAIHDQWDDLDGLWAPSTLSGAPIVCLYEAACSSMPVTPGFSRALDHPLIWTIIEHYAAGIGYSIG